MGKAIVRLVGLLVCGVLMAQSYRPVEIKPSIIGSHRYLTPEDLWQVTLIGTTIQRRLLFRLEVYLYDEASGELLYRGSSFALRQPESVWEVDFEVLSGHGSIRQEGVSVQWWASVQRNGGYLPPGNYRIEYIAVETDEKCLWTGIELARRSAYFEILSDYVIEPVYPVEGDTICGTPHFVWELVGGGAEPYELLVYYGRVGWAEIAGVVPLARFIGIRSSQFSGMGSIVLEQEGWYTYVVRGSDGVISKPVWFYSIPDCLDSDETDVVESVINRGWWHQLDYTQESQTVRAHGDTIYLEWLQSCPEQARFKLSNQKGFAILTYKVSGPWHRAVALVPKGEQFKVEVEVCRTKNTQTWKILK